MAFTEFNDIEQVASYVAQRVPTLSGEQALTVEEISDGNLNYVYRVRNQAGQSLIVKQTPPYIRVIGEGWPLTQDRLRIEHNSLKLTAELCPERVPEILHYDADNHVLLMEDIGDHQNLRELMIQRVQLPALARQLGEYLAVTKFKSSVIGLASAQQKALVIESQNPDLCKIHEEVYFWDPFCDHERNDINPLLKETAEKIWQDTALKQEVAVLKRRYMNDTETLLHGDLHTGSVFATLDSTKIIDFEFAFCGPAGFDLGVLLANFMLNYCAQDNLPGAATERHDYQQWLLLTLEELWQQFSEKFIQLAETQCIDPSMTEASYHREYLEQLWQDSLGFAGVEMTRRILGIAHVPDIMAIEDDKLRAASETKALQLAVQLIKERNNIESTDKLCELIKTL